MTSGDRPATENSDAELNEGIRLLESELAELRGVLREVAVEHRDLDDSGTATRMTEELEAQIALLEARYDELRRRLRARTRGGRSSVATTP